MNRTGKIVTLAMLAAAAFILMTLVQFPILPSAPFLKYDPSDAICLLAGLAFGPAAGVLVVLLKDLLFLTLRGGSPFGPAADFAAAGTFVGVTSWVFRRLGGGPAPARLLLAGAIGVLARVLVMIPVNFIILSLEFGMPAERIRSMLLPAIVPFNAGKGLLNAVLAAVLAPPALRALAARSHLIDRGGR
jgi:riboflavin transporter FmnP